MTPHQDDPVVRYPAITPTKYCTDSTTIHQVPYQQHHIGSQLSLQPNGLPSHYESGTEAHSSAKCSLHAREHHSSKTNLSNNLQHTHSVFLHVQSFDLRHSHSNSHCLESKVTQQGFPQQRPRKVLQHRFVTDSRAPPTFGLPIIGHSTLLLSRQVKNKISHAVLSRGLLPSHVAHINMSQSNITTHPL